MSAQKVKMTFCRTCHAFSIFTFEVEHLRTNSNLRSNKSHTVLPPYHLSSSVNPMCEGSLCLSNIQFVLIINRINSVCVLYQFNRKLTAQIRTVFTMVRLNRIYQRMRFLFLFLFLFSCLWGVKQTTDTYPFKSVFLAKLSIARCTHNG